MSSAVVAAGLGPDKAHLAGSVTLDKRKLFVRGLSFDTSEESLRRAFEVFGPLEDCDVCVDKATGRSK